MTPKRISISLSHTVIYMTQGDDIFIFDDIILTFSNNKQFILKIYCVYNVV
jgi:hypothetical protein